MRCRRWIAATSLIAAALASRPARADDDGEADRQFERGRRLLLQGQLEPACAALETSNGIDPRAGTLILIGECRARRHQIASAWAAYKDALARAVDPRKQAIATRRIAELEPRLSYLLISVAEDHRVDGLIVTRDGQTVDAGAWNTGIPLDGGAYTVVASAPGYAAWSTMATVPAERGRIDVDVPLLRRIEPPVEHPPEPVPAPTVPPPTAPSPTVPSPTTPPGRPAPDPATASAVHAAAPTLWTPRRKLAVVLVGASAAGGIAGAVLGVQARDDERTALALCPTARTSCLDARRANQLLDDASHRALGANIAFGAAAALLIGGGVLWFTGAPHADDRLAVVPQITPELAGVIVVGRL
jgi:hypothetical protein